MHGKMAGILHIACHVLTAMVKGPKLEPTLFPQRGFFIRTYRIVAPSPHIKVDFNTLKNNLVFDFIINSIYDK